MYIIIAVSHRALDIKDHSGTATPISLRHKKTHAPVVSPSCMVAVLEVTSTDRYHF